MNDNIDHVDDYFLEWSKGRLDDKKRQIVEHHLEMCEHCAKYYQTMQTIMEHPKTNQLPFLQKDPYLPARIKSKVESEQEEHEANKLALLGLSKAMTGSLILFGLLFGFLLGQQLVYIADEEQTPEQISVTELYYEGMAQPNFGSKLEEVLTEIEGD